MAAYDIVTTRYRSALHARWSVFFDYLEVPYAYEPMVFETDAPSAACTPAFWLPEQRLWFHAADSAPVWWERFACCAAGDVEGTQWSGMFEEDWEDRCPPEDVVFVPFDVSEQWQGGALLHLGAFPRSFSGDDISPWMSNEHAGMYTHNDALYRWTLCPQCGLFGATYGGFTEVLACGCLQSHKDDQSGSPRLLEAFRAAEVWALGVSARADARPWVEGTHPVVRESLVDQEGVAQAYSLCMGTCFSLEDQLRADLPVGAFVEVTEDADVLCGQCPGFVCCECGMRPAPAAGESCQVCRPQVLITYARARQLLNVQAAQVGKAARRPAREINTLLNRAARRRHRDEFTLDDLGQGLDMARQWLADVSLLPSGPADSARLPEAEIHAMNGSALREALNSCVGCLVRATGASFPEAQTLLTQTTGAARRTEAGVEELRDTLLLAQRWIRNPAAFAAFVAPYSRRKQDPEFALVPEPVRLTAAPHDTVCGLCTDLVAAGEPLGRLPHRGGVRYAVMGWLCEHCLGPRRTTPRRLDVILRVFHHLLPGAPVSLNNAEAHLLADWLAQQPATSSTALLDKAQGILTGFADTPLVSEELPFTCAEAVLTALCPAPQVGEHTPGDKETAVLHAVAHHVQEWRQNPLQLDADRYERRALWRLDIMKRSAQPTLLSSRPAPFPL